MRIQYFCFLLCKNGPTGRFYIQYSINMPNPAATIAANTSGQKYLRTMMFACSWKRHNKNPKIPNRKVRNTPDTPMNSRAGNPKNPAHSVSNLCGTGVTADRKMIKMPWRANMSCAAANRSVDAKVSISQTPIESNSHNPIMYVIVVPISDPNAAAMTTGTARFLSATMGGVIKTSGGTNRNIDSHIVRKHTIQTIDGCADFFNK